MMMRELIAQTNRKDVLSLAKKNIIKIERDKSELFVKFQSQLTEIMVHEIILEKETYKTIKRMIVWNCMGIQQILKKLGII